MNEIIENFIQMICTAICTLICVRRVKETGDHAWIMLGLSSFVYFLGDLYWQLYMMFYGESPYYSYVPYLGWYAGYFFLILMLIEIRGERVLRSGKKILWLIPVFTTGMCIFYLQWGDIVGNIVSVLLMTPLIWIPAEGLLLVHEGLTDRNENKYIYLAVLFFCAAEYSSWTASCYMDNETITNVYFMFDTLISVSFLLLPPALKKAVRV